MKENLENSPVPKYDYIQLEIYRFIQLNHSFNNHSQLFRNLFLFNFHHLNSVVQILDYEIVPFWKLWRIIIPYSAYSTGYYPQQPLSPTGSEEVMREWETGNGSKEE